MIRLAICCAFAVIPVLAQFENLATNNDGSILFFSSRLPMRGTAQSSHYKAFVADSGGIGLFVERAREMAGTTPGGHPLTNYYSVQAVSTTVDGRVRAVNVSRDCHGGSGCVPIEKWENGAHC